MSSFKNQGNFIAFVVVVVVVIVSLIACNFFSLFPLLPLPFPLLAKPLVIFLNLFKGNWFLMASFH